MEQTILKTLVLTMMAKQRKLGQIDFFLVGLVPARIIWLDGKEENIELASKIKVEPFGAGRLLMGQRIARSRFGDKLKNEHLKQLVDELVRSITTVQKEKKLAGRGFSFLALTA